jgi:microcystin degradation protein MlrC
LHNRYVSLDRCAEYEENVIGIVCGRETPNGDKAMKVFIASLGTETNTFSPIPTGYANFEETCLFRHGNYGHQVPLCAGALQLFREKARARGWSVVESLCAFAQPAGLTVQAVYESFRNEIVQDLQSALPVDVVLLNLHGAMMAHGYDDCEGDLLAHIRHIVGPDVPIGVELDPHCHLTEAMISNASILITYKEYPHIDKVERAAELFELIADTALGRITPVASVFDCRMIAVFPTTHEPMLSYVSRLKELEEQEGVLSISLIHGFTHGDMPAMGTKVLVVTDGQPEYGDGLAEKLGRELFELRDGLGLSYLTVDEGLRQAVESDKSPVVVADVADNPGSGAPGDATHLLRAMVECDIRNAALASIWDPVAVSVVKDAGVGAQLDLRIGAKMGPASGSPVDLRVTVTGVVAEAVQTTAAVGRNGSRMKVRMGDTVAVHAKGIDIVLNSVRTQVYSPEAFTVVGIDPREKHVLVVKSAQHFYAAFAPFAARVLYVDAGGPIVRDITQLTYERVSRRKWPFVEDPFSSGSS